MVYKMAQGFILVRATRKRNTLRPVRGCSCILRWFVVGGYKWARKGPVPQVFGEVFENYVSCLVEMVGSLSLRWPHHPQAGEDSACVGVGVGKRASP